MKRIYPIIISSLALLLLFPMAAQAQVTAENVVYKRSGEVMIVKMDLNTKDVDVPRNKVWLVTPEIVSGSNSEELSSVGIYSRGRYYYYLRRNGEEMLSGEDEKSIREKSLPETVKYETTVPYAEWMETSDLVLNIKEYGCCGNVYDEGSEKLASVEKVVPKVKPEFVPVLAYVRPEAETHKTRSQSGSAYIDFPVNVTEIREDYHSNASELAKITATIDAVRGDKDVQLTGVTVTGYASPDGPYDGNERLAKGRTESLSKYVGSLYELPAGALKANHVAENWQGLEAFVKESSLADKDAILEIIESDRTPDDKEWMIKSKYPESYRTLLSDCYPYLRRTDYEVTYDVRQYTDAGEIRELVTTRPQNLSLEEFYVAAQGLEPGSEEFNKIFEVAVRMFPEDETANLNAANAAMEERDLKAAERYLENAGDSPEAVYARGILAALKKDYSSAETLLQQAKAAGISQADDALRQVAEQLAE